MAGHSVAVRLAQLIAPCGAPTKTPCTAGSFIRAGWRVPP